MRKFKLFLLALTGAAILMLGGCKEKQTYDEAAFENDMEIGGGGVGVHVDAYNVLITHWLWVG